MIYNYTELAGNCFKTETSPKLRKKQSLNVSYGLHLLKNFVLVKGHELFFTEAYLEPS